MAGTEEVELDEVVTVVEVDVVVDVDGVEVDVEVEGGTAWPNA